MSAPFFPQSADSAVSRPRRINPWRMFVGSMIPNWLQCRKEISPGAKLAYARLAQYAGKDGECFPKQETLAAELGVSERTANEYIRALVRFKLIEKERPGLGRANRYFFLDHPWIHEGQPESASGSTHERQETSVADQQKSSHQERQKTSAPINKENQMQGESKIRDDTHKHVCHRLPQSVDEGVEVARQLGIEEEFARQEYHAKKSVGWKDGYGNPITSWSDHLQARWTTEQRKRTECRSNGRASRKSPPPRNFASADYHQPVKDF